MTSIADIHAERKRRLIILLEVVKPSALASAINMNVTQLRQLRCGFRNVSDSQWERIQAGCKQLGVTVP